MAGGVYRLGVALHDPDKPEQIVGVADDWIQEPEAPWERTGYVPNVVFSCGVIPEDDGMVRIYWGAADTVLCGGTASVADLANLCLTRSRAPV